MGVAHIVRYGKVKRREEKRRAYSRCVFGADLTCSPDYKLWTVRHIVDFLTLQQQHVSAKHSAGQWLDL